MISTEFGHPKAFAEGFNPESLKTHSFGTQLNFWDWKEGKIIQQIELGEDVVPLETRFLHDPNSTHGHVF